MGSWLASNWSAVWPNLEASLIWATPAFVTHHVLMRRHLDRRHDQLKQHIAAAQPGASIETEARP
jgi:hypothetical protein